jgi:O-acetyl-ADP-ribose deacetylase (regulator of RNase III)
MFIVQGCNAQGVMGSGVAKLLRDLDENVFTEYRALYEAQGDRLNPGQCVWVECKPLGKVIINAVTQINYGREKNTRYADYDAISKAFEDIDREMLALFQFEETPRVAMPLIGAGLGNGDWVIISTIIERAAKHFQPVVYTLDGKIPK